MENGTIGVWLIGALGSISATVILGALAIGKGAAGAVGLVTESRPFRELHLTPVDALRFGGCDIRSSRLTDSLAAAAGDVPEVAAQTLASSTLQIEAIQRHLTQGTRRNCGSAISALAEPVDHCDRPIRDDIAALVADMQAFKREIGADEVVVVNLASTEPALAQAPCHDSLEEFERCLDANDNNVVSAGSIYAYAAISAGCPYINFTPSNGALLPAVIELAEQRGVPIMGNDGKTGETLVKSVLAPMFAMRNLEVLSWEGFNILGNLDGKVLANPENKEAKIRTKDAVLPKILGYSPHSGVHINYVPSLKDKKIAWDFVHFRGFLGAEMSLQFTWQGIDSILAAPLVLDLVRWAVLAKSRGEAGLMTHLGCYFKNPLGVTEHGFHEQYAHLRKYCAHVMESRKSV